MNVLFLSPSWPVEMNAYVQALAACGARVWGVTDQPLSALPPRTKEALSGVLHVFGFSDKAAFVDTVVQQVRNRGLTFDRVEGLWEPLVLPAAAIREALGIPGMSVEVTRRFRDKELMKATLREAGVRVPRSARAESPDEVREAVERIGLPVIVKPIAGAGSADTYRVDDLVELEAVLERTRHVPEVSVEEFVDGEEFTHDTLCVGGIPVYENVCQYLPRPLIARTQEGCSPIVITLRDLEDPSLREGIALGRRVLSVLGMQTGLTHLEWYRKADGEVVFGEIGCRPGGAHLIDQMNFSHDGDLYVSWACAVLGEPVAPMPERRYACAIVFKRAYGMGFIAEHEGLDEFMAEYGEHVVWQGLSPVGTPRRDWRATLVSDGFLIVRHADQATALRIARTAADRVQLVARGA